MFLCLSITVACGHSPNTAKCRMLNYSATSNNMKLVHWPLIGWAAIFGTARRGLGGAPARPGPSSLYQINSPPSTASVPITVLQYNGPLLCRFNMSIEGLTMGIYEAVYNPLSPLECYQPLQLGSSHKFGV